MACEGYAPSCHGVDNFSGGFLLLDVFSAGKKGNKKVNKNDLILVNGKITRVIAVNDITDDIMHVYLLYKMRALYVHILTLRCPHDTL